MRKIALWLVISLGVVCRVLGADCDAYKDRLDQAGKNAALREAQRLQRENPDDPCTDYALGFYYRSYEWDYPRALHFFRRAMEKNPEYYRPHLDIGLIHHARREYDPARRSFLEAIDLARKAGATTGEADAKIELGLLYRYSGDADKALKYLSEAAELSETNLVLQSTARMRTAEVLIDLGEYEEAKKTCHAILERLKASGVDYGVAYTYNLLGKACLAAGDRVTDRDRAHQEYQGAIAHYQQSLQTAKPRTRPRLLVSLGDAYLGDGDLAMALSYYESFLKEAPAADPSFTEQHSRAWGGMGEIALNRGEHGKALDYFRRAAGLAVEDKIKKLEMSWMKKIGDVYVATGERDQAREQYDKVLQTVRDGFLALGSQPGAEEYVFFNDEFKVYEAAVDLLLKQGQTRAAFEYLESAREQSVLQTLFQSRIVDKLLQGAARDAFHAELAALKGEVDGKHRERLEKLDRQKTSPEPERRRLDDEIKKLEADIAERYGRIVGAIRQMLRGRQRPNLAAELQAHALKENEALIEYMVADEKTFVFIVTKDALQYEVIPIGSKGYRINAAGKKEKASGLSQLMRAVSPLLFPAPDDATTDRLSVDAISAGINLPALKRLYDAIFSQAVQRHLRPGSQLIIVPDDALYYLPFDMLVTGFSARGAPEYLVSKYPISYTYSASLVLESATPSDATSLVSLLVGNPDFGPTAETKGELARRLRSARFFLGDGLPPLRYAEEEVERISKIAGRRIKLIGAQATEAAFKRSAAEAGLIHLATHSFFNRRNYLDSSVIFALNEKIDQQGEDGVLYLHEIMGLRLKALLVVLTGCETGLGRLRRGGGLEGISRAFLTAGVPSTVGTLWPVADSEATSKLVTGFYQYLARGLNKREALQRAKLDLIAADPYADPFFWAAPILIGNTQAVKIAEHSPLLLKLVVSPRLLTLALIASLFVLVSLFYFARIRRRA